jgi:type I restriction enzyme M protein
MIEDIKKTLWATADKLRANMDAAEYKHIVLGLIFVKYISDTFQSHRAELLVKFADANDPFYLDNADAALVAEQLEERDYYKEANVFWVPSRPLGGVARAGQAGRHWQTHRRRAGAH